VLAASEIGVVMMLFVIGLELSPARLRVMRKPVFGAGGLQVLLSGLALGALAMFGGQLGWKAATVVGLGLALSSTAVCLQLLSERKGLSADYGRLAFAILLFQDLAAIPLLAEGGGREAYPWLDRCLVVDVPVAVQQARVMRRDGIEAELAQRMMAAQATREARLAIADDIVVNDGPIEALQVQVEALDRRYRAMAESLRG
ncbi:dephospho-CoA kinase, partial [Lysobacter sp. 2RAB21]